MGRHARLVLGDEETKLNISPMIDMVFILLIFFIVTTVFVDERGIPAERPMPAVGRQEDRAEPVIFRVTAAGRVMHDGAEVSLMRVEGIVRSARSLDPEVPTILQVERGARAGLMIQVMDQARRGDPDVPVSITVVD